MIWIICNAQMRLKSGAVVYESLPTTLDRCESFEFYGMVKNM